MQKTFLHPSTFDDSVCIQWAAYHSSVQQASANPVSITATVPLFSEKSDSPAMLGDDMNLLRKIMKFPNLGYIPIFACNSPILHNIDIFSGNVLKSLVNITSQSCFEVYKQKNHCTSVQEIFQLDQDGQLLPIPLLPNQVRQTRF